MQVQTTAYSHAGGISSYPHGGTDWQVAIDSVFASIVHDATGSADLLAHWVTGLAPNTSHWVRARWVDAYGQVGAWSTSLPPTVGR